MPDEQPIRPGDRVVHLQIPGVCTVVERRGKFLALESDRGVRRLVHEVSVRRLNGAPPAPRDA
jgi:hypothetical protein